MPTVWLAEPGRSASTYGGRCGKQPQGGKCGKHQGLVGHRVGCAATSQLASSATQTVTLAQQLRPPAPRHRTLKFLLPPSSSSRMAATLPQLERGAGCRQRSVRPTCSDVHRAGMLKQCKLLNSIRQAAGACMCAAPRSPVAAVKRQPNSQQLHLGHNTHSTASALPEDGPFTHR